MRNAGIRCGVGVMKRVARWLAPGVLACCAGAWPLAATAAASSPPQVAQRACSAIAHNVGAAQGPPLFLRSYVGAGGAEGPALKTVAFTYDNALAVIALVACGDLPRAERVGEALREGALAPPRLRNAYRAGAVHGAVLPNGWWDAKAKQWAEDPYQMGTATGNVAWAGLALLALHQATGEARWRVAAAHLATWIADNTRAAQGAAGFTGGVTGFDAKPVKLTWQSTEHNIDATALFTWLAGASPAPQWTQAAASARRFVDAQWDAAGGHFRIGTLPDGAENTTACAIDVQLWAQLLPGARPEWRRAVPYAQAHYGVDGGFDFNTDRDGVWLEGTAQAALVYRQLGDAAKADALLKTIAGEFAPDGYVYATREARVTTGLALGPGSTSADFYYYHWPHLAATAWAALAARDWNPFVPHVVVRMPVRPAR